MNIEEMKATYQKATEGKDKPDVGWSDLNAEDVERLKTKTYAEVAVPLFEKLHKVGIHGPTQRWSAYYISMERFKELQEIAEREVEAGTMPPVQSEKMARYGILNLYYKGTLVIGTEHLTGDQVVPVERDLIRAVESTLPAYDVIDTSPIDEAHYSNNLKQL